VLYTTHYMEEAERLCRRIGILDGGVLIAEGTRSELVARVGEHEVISLTTTSDAGRAEFVERCRALAGVHGARLSSGAVEVLVDDADGLLAAVVQQAGSAGMGITGASVLAPNLETVFLQLTGRALRD
jgi:ABC-2 type transport system ATP-binding protein